jgi:hypothetical protein
MGIGAGFFLVAIGAILRFAVSVTTTGFNLHTIGVILMVVGGLGIVVEFAIFAPRRRTVVSTQPAARRTVVEEHDALI